MKPQHFFYCFIVILVFFVTCKEDKDIPVTGISLHKNELTLLPGDTATLMATIEPADATNKNIIWASSNPEVATVSNAGLVTAIADGDATITATTQDNHKTANCNLIVAKKIPITGITFDKSELKLSAGDTVTLMTSIEPANATNKHIIWASSNPEVATISDTGLVTALADGEATITAITQDGNKKATCSVSIDYRNKWIGDWDFVVESSWHINMDSGYEIFYYLGKISLGNSDTTLTIEYMEHNSPFMERFITDLAVDKLGYLDNHSTYRYSVSGQFEGNDKVYIEANYRMPSSSMGGASNIIEGTKKKGDKK